MTPRLEELQLFKTQQETKSAGSSDQRETMKKTPREKRKLHSDLTEDQSPAKRRKNMSQNLKMTNEKDRVEAAESVEKSKVEVISTKPESASKRETNDQSPRKPKHYNDQCTAFVSNIGVQASCLLPCFSFLHLEFHFSIDLHCGLIHNLFSVFIVNANGR